jgi:hypothetical protein
VWHPHCGSVVTTLAVHIVKHACVHVGEHGICSARCQLDNVEIVGDKADPSAEHFAYVWHADGHLRGRCSSYVAACSEWTCGADVIWNVSPVPSILSCGTAILHDSNSTTVSSVLQLTALGSGRRNSTSQTSSNALPQSPKLLLSRLQKTFYIHAPHRLAVSSSPTESVS